MKCGLQELNKENVMFILDKHINLLEIMRDGFEEKAITDSAGGINRVGQVMFCIIMCEKH